MATQFRSPSAKCDGDADFVFLARDTASPYVDYRPLLLPGKPGIRRYKATYVLGDDEIGLPSEEISLAATPWSHATTLCGSKPRLQMS